jgi:membrane protein required for colicin V production
LIIDIIFAVWMVMAIFKGFQKGLIVAVLSIVAFIIGIAAALKLSAVAAGWLGETTNINAKWLPLASFILVFLIVVLAINRGAKLIEKAVELAMLGWVNKAAGILLYMALYTLIFSVLLFFAEQLNIFTDQTIAESVTYVYISPLGPKVIEMIAVVIPVFKNVFAELQAFFENLSSRLPS